MSIVCKKLYAHLNRVLICCRPTMVVSPFNSGRLPFNQRPSSPLPTIIREVEGDLFTARRDTSLAHCVSSDMKMGAGIAVHFRAKFGRVDDLLSQKKTVGEVAYLKDSQRFIFYLVTKKRYFHKPTEKTLHRSLLDMRDKCQKLGVTKLAMPRIGCGLDGLKWPSVFHLLKEVFENCGIEITIYSIPDKKRKSVTPHLNKSQENFRKFFEPKEPHSLPENAMNSKRKFHTDSLEENSYMPKRMKHLTVSSHDRKFIAVDDFDARSPSKKKSSANLSSETSLSFIHREADLGSDNLDAEALSSFSGDCPFQSSPKKRNITVSSQDRKPVADGYFHAPSPSKKKSSAKRSSEASFPTTCREVDLEYDKFDIEALSTFSGDCPFLTSPTKSPQTNNNLELSEENSIHLPDQKRAKSISSSPCREYMEVTTAPSSSKKHKRRSSSKSHSEEKVKKERKTRSASKSHSEEKAKREKRRSSSKSRSEEKSEKKKRRSSSKSSSREKVKKEKRRSSKNCSEEKLKKEKHRSYGIVMGPLDSDTSESSQAKAHVVSERFPSFNKRRPSKDLSDSFDESAEMKRTSLNVTSLQENANRPRSKSSLDLPSDEDTVYRRRETKKERLASPHKGSSHKHSRQLEKTQEDTTMRKPFNSTEMDRFPYQSKGRWVEMARTSSKDDDSLYKKMKTTPDKPFRKAPNSAVGRMYSDKETSNVSVKKRLSLGR